MMRLVYLMLALGFGAALLTSGFPSLAGPVTEPPRREIIVAPQPPSAASEQVVSAVGETHIRRDGSGQFHLDATVNGKALPFLVDTGADKVALTIESARTLGLYVDPASFETVAMGAGGAVRGQHITIDRLEVGGRALTAVDALVLDGLAINLLGQSALGQLGGVELRGDEMVLR